MMNRIPEPSSLSGAPFDAEACHRALAARDRRFDGMFFVAVETTGIYCRPICTARTPRVDRCTFFRLAAEAEKNGFRACFRCRPELAPGTSPVARSQVDAVATLVAAAVARIDAGQLNDSGLEELSAGLGVTSRHLRRSMQAELGVGPLELAQSRRLAMAKRLLQDTELPISELAFASGFQSLRRFNALFRARFGRTPSSIRRSLGGDPQSTFGVRLDFRPPLDWAALVGFLAARAVPGVEVVEGGRYTRTVRMGDVRGWLAVEPLPDQPALWAELSTSLAPKVVAVVARLRRLFDLDAQPGLIAAHLQADPTLRLRIAAHPGLRVPGSFDTFETAVRIVLGQQVSVAAATTLASRLASKLGPQIATPHPGVSRAMPSAAELAAAPVEALASLGILPARARTLSAMAEQVRSGTLVLDSPLDVSSLLSAMERVPGIGPWTGQMFAMRVLSWPDAFPSGDLGIRKALGGSSGEIEKRAELWRPWRAYAAMHLWHSLSGDSP
jgi:AraC family transcriptional regulator, regulatory protein of adaptative response / DNA-3-methyladenine glycosylase II